MQTITGHKFRGANSIGLVVGGIGVGALLMYLFDPERGRGRRSKLGDQVTSKVHQLSDAAGSKARHLRNRAQGVIHEVGSVLKTSKGSKASLEGTDKKESDVAFEPESNEPLDLV